MLQQILQNMYIDPELLEKLEDDERKHLFGKMREEQVRRWNNWQEQLEKEDSVRTKPKLPPKPGRKKVEIMLGSDGNPWTWVIDDVYHFDDGTELCRNDQRLDRFFSKEMSTMRNNEEEEEEEAEDREVRATLSRAQLLAQILERNNTDKEKTNWLKRKQDKLKTKQMPANSDTTDSGENIEVDRVHSSHRNTRRKETDVQDTIHKRVENQEESEPPSKDNDANDLATDNQISEIARKARVLISTKSSMADKNERNNLVSHVSRSSMLSITRTKNRPGKPPSRAAIVEWFRTEEKPRGSGWDSDSNCVAPWFHGMVSRQEAEELLSIQSKGTFLVRFCERIWGYVVSYRATEKCKHYVIDASNDHYQFLGEGFQKFNKLGDLIRYYQSRSFVPNDGDRLVRPCAKSNNEQIFNELFA